MPEDSFPPLPPGDYDPVWRFFLENIRPAGDTFIFRDPETGAELMYDAPTDEEADRRQRKFDADRAAFFEKQKLKEKLKEKEKKVAGSSTGEPSLVEEDEEKKANPARKKKKKKKASGEEDGAGSGKKVKVEEVLEEEDKLPNELAVETLDTELPKEPAVETLNTDAVARENNSNSGNGVDGEPHVAPGLHVWPTHIMSRPESDFKNRLMHVLGKPFSQEEYDKLVGWATIRTPTMKERWTLQGVKFYLSAHEVNKSYFDRYPDLEERVKSTSYPNQLALLRGFSFWLKNLSHEDQFRPWRDDFLQYNVVPIE